MTSRQSNGYELCRGVNSGSCGCADRRRDPCDSIERLLQMAEDDVEAAIKMELHRIDMEIPA